MADEKLKICIATSTRADWGLLSPLAAALKARDDVKLDIIATNMHLIERFGHTIDEIRADGFDCIHTAPMPDSDAASGSGEDEAIAMGLGLVNMARCLADVAPDILVILGDRYEMLAMASAATVMRIPIAHISGGEISEGAIDDNIRHAITKLSALHFTATEAYRQRVIQMGEDPARVINTGALGVWNIKHQPLLTLGELNRQLGFEIEPGRTLLATYHPATLDSDGLAPREKCMHMLAALDRHPDLKVIITYPNNDPGADGIIEAITGYAAARPGRVLLVKSLGMLRYLSALQYVAAVVGNSSSGIVEVPSMGIPTVDIGARQRGRIAAPSVIHCGNDTDSIADAIGSALAPRMQQLAAACQNPYHKPDTVDIMVAALTGTDPRGLLPKKFHDTP